MSVRRSRTEGSMGSSARQFCVAALACAVLGGCASRQAAPPEQAESYQLRGAPVSAVGERAARTASSLVGSPYRYGGHTPDGFDCSGLVYYAYRAAGLSVPRTSTQQFQAARPIPITEARAGDLLFFRYQRNVSHVGIYLGDQRFVHAPSSGKAVSVASLSEAHYRERFIGAGRF